MKIRMNRKITAGLVALGVTGLTAGFLAVSGGTASAAAVLDLNYTCPFPVIGTQPIKVNINASIPDIATVNKPTGAFDIVAITTLNNETRSGLRTSQVATIEGFATSFAHISAPGIENDLSVEVDVEKTDVPRTTGEFTVKATGQTPSLTFRQPGDLKITVNGLEMEVTAKKADGSLAQIPDSPNPFTTACTLSPGQNNLLKEAKILPDDGGTTTTTTTEPTTTTTESTTTSTEPTTTTESTTTGSTTTGSTTTSTEPTETTSTEPTETTSTEPTTTTTGSTTASTEPTETTTTTPTTTTTGSTTTSTTKPTTTTTTSQSTTTTTKPTTTTTTTKPTTTTTSPTTTTTKPTTTTTSPTTTTSESTTTTEPTTTTTEPTTTTVPTSTTVPVAYVPTYNSGSSSGLADTGVSVAWKIGAGLLMVGLGVGLMFFMRQRARRRA